MVGESSTDILEAQIATSGESNNDFVIERAFYTKPFSKEEWLQIIHKGRAGAHDKYDGFISCLARVTNNQVITGLFPTGVHSETLASQKVYFGLDDLSEPEAIGTLLDRKGEEYGVTAAQLWFNSHGALKKLDFTISTDFLRAKQVKAIATDLLHKIPQEFWPEKLEIKLDDREHSHEKRPAYYLMLKTQEDWMIFKSPKIRDVWKTPWD